MDKYKLLSEKLLEVRQLYNALSILHWDQKTYMPPMGIDQRGVQIGILSRMAHERRIDPEIGELLADLKAQHDKDSSLTSIQLRNIELWQRDYDKATKLPTKFVQKLTKAEVVTEHKWEEAKRKSDFSLVSKELGELIDLTKEKAMYIDPDKPAYAVLVDLYEPTITPEKISEYFTPLRDAVVELVKKCKSAEDSGLKINPNVIKCAVTYEQQKEISKLLMEVTGLDPKKTRIDESEHPFTTGYAHDVRITTHYLDKDPMGSFYSVMHEAGHALYESELPEEHLWTAIGESISLGVHESQSRFNENMIGKSPEYLEYLFPKLQKIIPAYKNINLTDFTRAVNYVNPSEIRIYADEVTYNLHVILRFELEKEIFTNKIGLEELPQAWNEKMSEYLGVEIKGDGMGVLQDTHWYGGAFGYFPTYVLGNIYGGQMLNTMRSQLDVTDCLKSGEVNKMHDWLIKEVHQRGSLYDPAELVKEITGELPDAKYFIEYMNNKFKKIYEL